MNLPSFNGANTQIQNIAYSAETLVHEMDHADVEPVKSRKPRSKRGPYYSAEVLQDGYHYRKYGQKFSRSNPYPTCYYKCAHNGCPVKRQISRSDDGKIVNQYRNKHNHAPPQMRKIRAETQDEFVNLIREEGRFLDWEAGQNAASVEKKLVVTTAIGIDPVEDSHTWRKYGSKIVKASTVQKSYYRCAVASCGAKKLIQRPTADGDSEEAQVVYQGAHNHALPPRTTDRPADATPGPAPTVVPTLAPVPAPAPMSAPPMHPDPTPIPAVTIPDLYSDISPLLGGPFPTQPTLHSDDTLLYSTGSDFGSYWGGSVSTSMGMGSIELPRESMLGFGAVDLTGLPSIPTLQF